MINERLNIQLIYAEGHKDFYTEEHEIRTKFGRFHVKETYSSDGALNVWVKELKS